jgi:DNA-binding transcriptional LysR family regulator
VDIRQLTYFHAVAKHKSFTKASTVLHLSQPSLSKMVKSLEDELEMELIDRSARQIELTEAGEIVFEQSKMILESLDNLSSNLYDLMNLKKGKIKIGIPPLIGFLFFPKIIKKFKASYPEIQIQLVEHGANRVQQEVNDGLLDLGVVVMPLNEDKLEIVSFLTEHLMLFVHHSHPLANREKVSMKELENESFIIFKEGFTLHDRVIEECITAGFHPKISYESSQWDFISGMIGENLGVSIFPESIAKKVDQNLVKAIPIVDPSLPYKLGIIKKKDKYVTYATREFINMLSPFSE